MRFFCACLDEFMINSQKTTDSKYNQGEFNATGNVITSDHRVADRKAILDFIKLVQSTDDNLESSKFDESSMDDNNGGKIYF